MTVPTYRFRLRILMAFICCIEINFGKRIHTRRNAQCSNWIPLRARTRFGIAGQNQPFAAWLIKMGVQCIANGTPGKEKGGRKAKQDDGWLTLWWMCASCLGVAYRPASVAGHRQIFRPSVDEQNDGDVAAEERMSRWRKRNDRLLSLLPLDCRRSPSRWALDLFWRPIFALDPVSIEARTPTRSGRWAMQHHRRIPLKRKIRFDCYSTLLSFRGVAPGAMNWLVFHLRN